ncbi:anthranilate phosphoribosyltransferase, partial [uncultured Corynebacterium sp.]|uniref:anthranilate phosphoribosyltransferase n=1 Tax=uncultured Corynebacterium sp. TaxID=159447 RepID=UPI0025F3D337
DSIVGTGGDGAHTVNISTMSSVVVAASGTPVLKHGNRAASSKSGGADMLEALGLDIADGHVASPEHPDFKLRFLFAATYHPAMRYAGPVRSQLAVPTLFNLLGPLTNPAQPSSSLIGCAFEDQMETMAGAFARRGQRVLVVRGSDGLDEVTVTGTTRVFVVEDGTVTEDVIDPRDYGMELAPADSLRGGEPAYNADVARRVWNGELRGPIRDAVLLNSAAAVVAAKGLGGRDLKTAMAEALEVVRGTLDSGRCAEIMKAATGR